MDRRSWPWKKKTSEKTVTSTDSVGASDQDNSKVVDHVQISKETYTHLTGLEDQLEVLNDEVKALNEKLSTAQAEMTTKDNLVKQHAKVAEEAVSGWEKAEAEALALKNQLESVTLLKLTVEERASHLDGALKECMKQVRSVKEESEQKLHDVVFAKTKQWEKVKFELQSKIVDFEQELLRASAENAALSRSLQERSNMLMKISEEKSQADAEIEVLKTHIQSCEREISSLKYEVHIVSKELEIRNEEKNMSVRLAEVANKQHLEDVKKITKLEAECQRLRGLVRKKLPGPAALAQMKLEVENLGRDNGETKLRRSPAKSPNPHLGAAPDFALENVQQCHRENDFLTARLLSTEEETKMLKEALSKRNSELQASRNICAKTSSKLRGLEAQFLVLNQQKSPSKSNHEIPMEGFVSQNESNPPSLTSMSEDGVDEEGSCSESWGTALISELSHLKKEKDVEKPNRADSSNHLELMDDFLEMERLACLSTESKGTLTGSDVVMGSIRTEDADATLLVEVPKDGAHQKEQLPHLDTATNLVSSNKEQPSGGLISERNEAPLGKLQARIALIIGAQTKDSDMGKLVEDIKRIVDDIQEELPQHSVSCIVEETHARDDTCGPKHCAEDMGETVDSGISLSHCSNSCIDAKPAIDQDLKNAISHIHDFVLSLGKEAMEIWSRSSGCHQLSQKVGEFSDCVDKVLCSEMDIENFVVALSSILSETKELNYRIVGGKDSEGESNSSDCIDKVALLENKVVQHEPRKERFSSDCPLVPHSSSDPEILQEGHASPKFELKGTFDRCSLEDFKQLKLDKDSLTVELARCTESLQQTRFQLLETEQQLAELKSQLAASQKSNSLAETQLKCMAESYKSLESRAQELETDINLLRSKAETLDNELQQERQSHQDDLSKCKDLQEQLERNQKCSTCSLVIDADVDTKTKQEREIAAAAEKLAECQETIFLLGRQLKSLRPPTEQMSSLPDERLQMNEDFLDDILSANGSNPQGRHSLQLSDHTELENIDSAMQRMGGESPLDGYNSHFSPSDTEASLIPMSPISSKRPKHRSSRSSSSSSSSNPVPEKHGRGFSRFFSKGKSDH